MKQKVEMRVVPIGDIEPGKRYREEFGDIAELAVDINNKGLISPLAVMAKDGDEGGFLLLAGERRLRAMRKNEASEVPVRIYPSGMSELQIRSIELSENLYRKNLEWHEKAVLTSEIHRLEQELHGAKVSTSPDAQGHGVRDTAAMLNVSKSSVSDDLQLADAYKKMPQIFEGCKNKSDAQKILRKAHESIVRQELAARVAASPTGNIKKKLMDAFVVGDCFEGMAKIPDGSMSLVEIDPPYAIDLEKAKRGYTYGDSYNEVRSADYVKFLHSLFSESYRCMADHSWILCWFAHEPWFEVVYQSMIEAGFSGTRMVGIWRKPSGQTKQPQSNLANCIEMFFYMRKGSPAIARPGRSNVFDFPTIAASAKTHPTERPIEMMEEILSTFCFEGSRVMVPCCGSGNTLLAAHKLGMTPVGFELSGEFKDPYILKVNKL